MSFDAQHHLFKLLDESLRVVDALEVEILFALQRGAQNLAERAAERRVVEELDRQTRVRGGNLVLKERVCGGGGMRNVIGVGGLRGGVRVRNR